MHFSASLSHLFVEEAQDEEDDEDNNDTDEQAVDGHTISSLVDGLSNHKEEEGTCMVLVIEVHVCSGQ